MKTKQTKNSKFDVQTEIRKIGVYMEHQGDKIDLIAEQQGDIRKTLDEHGRILEAHTEMIGNLAIDLTIVKEDVSVLKEDVSVLKQDVSVLKEDVSVLKEDVSVLKQDVSVLKEDVSILKDGMKKKVDAEEFTTLERQVALLEKRH